MEDFVNVTELAGDEVSVEQVERICQRYYWAAEYCRGKDVLEVACGTGQGVGHLATVAKSISAGDYSEAILKIARENYRDRFRFHRFDAQKMPFTDASFDVVIIFEALYYIPDAQKFFNECKRVLRAGGVLLIATANKDLFDFNPSPHSFRYLGVPEMNSELGQLGFRCEFLGGYPMEAVSKRQRLLRPVKMMASKLGLIPRSKNGKKFLKRFVFGKMAKMPAEITAETCAYIRPAVLPANVPDTLHKVILCAAHLTS